MVSDLTAVSILVQRTHCSQDKINFMLLLTCLLFNYFTAWDQLIVLNVVLGFLFSDAVKILIYISYLSN